MNLESVSFGGMYAPEAFGFELLSCSMLSVLETRKRYSFQLYIRLIFCSVNVHQHGFDVKLLCLHLLLSR
jgi:hypothetical protein